MKNGSYAAAFARWFQSHESQRKAKSILQHCRVPDFPPPPPAPDEIALIVAEVGHQRTLELLDVHRGTLARWLSGETAMPRPCWSLLVLAAEGRLPGMSEDWSCFRFNGERLCIVGTNHGYTPA